MKPILYDGNKLNCVFPYNCNALHGSGDFAVVLLAGNMADIINLEKSLKEIGIKKEIDPAFSTPGFIPECILKNKFTESFLHYYKFKGLFLESLCLLSSCFFSIHTFLN